MGVVTRHEVGERRRVTQQIADRDAAAARLMPRDAERDLRGLRRVAAKDRDRVQPIEASAELAAGDFPIEDQSR